MKKKLLLPGKTSRSFLCLMLNITICQMLSSQEVVRKFDLSTVSHVYRDNVAMKTSIMLAEKLKIRPENFKNLDSVSLAILTPLRPVPIEEKSLIKDFKRFKDTAKLIYDTSEDFIPKQPASFHPYIKKSFDANIGDLLLL